MIAAIMPCRGRAEQTVKNVRRLLSTAGQVEWQLICMVDRDPVVMKALSNHNPPIWMMEAAQSGYWRALEQATDYWPEFDLIVNLANDLWAHDNWLEIGLAAYRARFGDGDGLMGFAGDGHGVGHSCHFLISRALLDRYGGWPTQYQHNFGDTELCQRAIRDRLYGKATHAILEHRHPERGMGSDDTVYAEGRATWQADRTLFERRRAAGWR